MKRIRGPVPRITKSSNDRYGDNSKGNLYSQDLSVSRNMEIYTPVVNGKVKQ